MGNFGVGKTVGDEKASTKNKFTTSAEYFAPYGSSNAHQNDEFDEFSTISKIKQVHTRLRMFRYKSKYSKMATSLLEKGLEQGKVLKYK